MISANPPSPGIQHLIDTIAKDKHLIAVLIDDVMLKQARIEKLEAVLTAKQRAALEGDG